MALESALKKQIMTEYATVENDTGSPEVQVAMLTRRISDLTEHLRRTSTRPPHRRGLLLWSAGVAGCLNYGDRPTTGTLAHRAPRSAPIDDEGAVPGHPGRSLSSFGTGRTGRTGRPAGRVHRTGPR
jgi:small subunit ribosomal protein S15